MSLSDRYALPNEAILASRCRITATTMVLPWDEDEYRAKAYNERIDLAFRKCQRSAEIIRLVRDQVFRNLKEIAQSLGMARTPSCTSDEFEEIEDHLRASPAALVSGLEDKLELLKNIEYGKSAISGIIHILETNTRPIIPIRANPYFRLLFELDGDKFNLDEYQVVSIDNDCDIAILLAGAGAGKTRVVVRWVETQGRFGTSQQRILCISFSDDAMREMRTRIHSESPGVNIFTFHAFALKSISMNAKLVKGFARERVIDDVEQVKILREIIDRHNARISAEEMSIVIQRYTLDGKRAAFATDLTKIQQRILTDYEDEKKKRKSLDYGDMIVLFHETLRDCPEFRSRISSQFDAIALDEAQDTFAIIINCLKFIRTNQKMLIVGDPSQRIYTFAGSAVNAFEEIQTKIGGDIFVLPYNHRSSSNLVSSMDRFIRTNTREIIRPVIPAKDSMGFIIHSKLTTQTEEIDWVVNKIAKLVKNDEYSLADIAILSRTNRVCQAFLRSLKKIGINNVRYNIQLKTRDKQLQNKARDLLSLLGTWPSSSRQINMERMSSLGCIVHELFCSDIHIDKVIIDSAIEALPYPCCPAIELPVHCGTINTVLNERLKLLQTIRERNSGSIGMLMSQFHDLGVEASLAPGQKRKMVHEIYRIQERYRKLVKDGNLQEFLFWLDRISENKSITVSTTHRSKGHEFKVVFMVGCVRGQWPHYFATQTGTNAAHDDEMRLFYVGCTRAEERLYLTSYCKQQNGKLVRESDYIGILRNLGCFAYD